MTRASGWCRISGDCDQPPWKARVWHLLNGLDNAWRPNQEHPRLQPRSFQPLLDQRTWDTLNQLDRGLSSPSRRLILHFLAQFPWKTVAEASGPLRVADLGCGRGQSALHLQAFSDGRVASYQGFDIAPRPEWGPLQAAHPFITCRQEDSHRVLAHLDPAVNLLFSQTSLEHIPDDLQLFRRIAAWMETRRAPLLQLHFLPSPVCRELYDLHGYRQYSPRKVVRLLNRLPADCRASLFTLGGKACCQLHREWVGPGPDRRESDVARYNELLRKALGEEVHPTDPPAFYALVIVSGGLIDPFSP
ncbi:MAG: class I SAM-dependent methyltransferase [Magnetococcales bacterium]|nr:class I SAM-dependent methyltransferase [Magnetococcales bacterium]